jgi:hypothetical protein
MRRRMTMKGWIKSAWVLVFLLLIIVGCSPSRSSTSPTPDAFPTGAFTNGDWTWEFKADGTFISSGPLGSETGTYSVNGNQIIITCQCCKEVKGTYQWSFDGTALKFIAINDECVNRKDVVDASTWLKKP